ncbi:hypothetical protein EDC19_2764 [Natranaerovirga hydrolytica]|uniref:Uncharacterized protein n=1 Tax=Natranaerovirga hydrolytica TaxID=680378 RepID=A0A4R1M974_9FIRM|nr:hypothetical protein [Natranaerovirga hydrolytica]TCK87920.1 hypothetical protein EDC19_2764 [Natranaerovirga hydrolytica]
MKKMLVGILLMSLTLVGCNSTGYETYDQAMSNYASIKEGKETVNMYFDITFNEDDLTREELEEWISYERMDMEMDMAYNEYQAIANNYIYFGGVGMNSRFYQNEDDIYLEIPLFNEIINIEMPKDIKMFSFEKETMEYVKEQWIEVLEEDDVIVEENTILTTSQGNVKAKRLNIHMSEDQLKKVFNIIFEEVLKSVVSYADLDLSNLNEAEVLEWIKDIKKQIENMNLKSFKGEVFIDYDGYPIYQLYELDIELNGIHEIENINIVFEEELIEYHTPQELVFPDFEGLEIRNIEELIQEEMKENDFIEYWIIN